MHVLTYIKQQYLEQCFSLYRAALQYNEHLFSLLILTKEHLRNRQGERDNHGKQKDFQRLYFCCRHFLQFQMLRIPRDANPIVTQYTPRCETFLQSDSAQ